MVGIYALYIYILLRLGDWSYNCPGFLPVITIWLKKLLKETVITHKPNQPFNKTLKSVSFRHSRDSFHYIPFRWTYMPGQNKSSSMCGQTLLIWRQKKHKQNTYCCILYILKQYVHEYVQMIFTETTVNLTIIYTNIMNGINITLL